MERSIALSNASVVNVPSVGTLSVKGLLVFLLDLPKPLINEHLDTIAIELRTSIQ